MQYSYYHEDVIKPYFYGGIMKNQFVMCAFLLGIGGVLYSMEPEVDALPWTSFSQQSEARLNTIGLFIYQESTLLPTNEHEETQRLINRVRDHLYKLRSSRYEYVHPETSEAIFKLIDTLEKRPGLENLPHPIHPAQNPSTRIVAASRTMKMTVPPFEASELNACEARSRAIELNDIFRASLQSVWDPFLSALQKKGE